jgi:transcriptional regulator with XRE-family HTH domain
MSLADGWTGKSAAALQAALRLTNEAFAERLGVGARTVAYWHSRPDSRPKPELQQALDTALDQAPAAARARFDELTSVQQPAQHPASEAERRLAADPNIGSALEWLDQHTAGEPGSARKAVARRLVVVESHELQDRGARRAHVRQRQVVDALEHYYGDFPSPYGIYGASCGSDAVIRTSVLTREDWLDLDCPLTPAHDRLRVSRAQQRSASELDEEAADAAVQRLAETLSMNVRMTNSPLYRLTSADIRKEHLGGRLSVVPFVEYALTADLLEGELIDGIATGATAMPLRDDHLPTAEAVLNVGERICVGGALALTAIARPADPLRGPADYLLLVQERSGHVLNAARRLAVIPKGFHQPMTDLGADAQIAATLRREMEEELFGREDVDGTLGDQRTADPMHPSRLPEPMRWLLDKPNRLRMECTGFGLNLVSGNYEFAGLIVIEDETFWTRFGGVIEANWESTALQRYSSLDDDLITDLVGDDAWSNEGLFALTQGLHRLSEIGDDRVKLPKIKWKVRP